MRILSSDHDPLATLLSQMVVNRHSRIRIAALGSDRNDRVGDVIPGVLHGLDGDVHATQIKTSFGLRSSQMIDHALTHRVIALHSAIARGE